MNTASNPITSSGSIAVFGATSGIARAVAAELARRGHDLVLIGRNEAALQAEAADLSVRFGKAFPVLAWDLYSPGPGDHASRFAELTALAPLAGVFLAAGVMPAENEAHTRAEATRAMFGTNLTEAVVVLNLFADHFKEKRGGFLAVLSSVSGDRARAKVKTYAASKAGLSAYLEGLRHALHAHGVRVCTIKPGPVRTPMTADYKGLPFLLADPEPVARAIVDGVERGRKEVYVPGWWRWIMAAFRMLPDALWRKVPG